MDVDTQDLLRQLDELKRKIGMQDEELHLDQPPPWSKSDLAELVKFEQFPSRITALAGRPPGNAREKMSDTQKRYPRMLYQAQRHPRNGKWVLYLEQPQRYQYPTVEHFEQARIEYEKFSEGCMRVVKTEGEMQAAFREGWRDSTADALQVREDEFKAAGQEAAERSYVDRNISEKAQAEVKAYEAERFGHQPEIPEKPRRGRPRKTVAA
jgi:hypothetical protein